MVSAFVSAFVATCFILSAFFKWQANESFREAVEEFSLLSGLSRSVHSLVVRLIPLIETVVAALLIVPQTNRVGALGAVCLALAFVLVVGLDSRPTIAHCGCWGVASADIPKSLYLARGGVLLLAAIGAAAVSKGSWNLAVELEAFGLMAPFALLLLELPQVAQIVRIQQLARGDLT